MVVFLLAAENWQLILWYGMTECDKENFVFCVFSLSDFFSLLKYVSCL